MLDSLGQVFAAKVFAAKFRRCGSGCSRPSATVPTMPAATDPMAAWDPKADDQNRFVGGALFQPDYSLGLLTEALRATMQRS